MSTLSLLRLAVWYFALLDALVSSLNWRYALSWCLRGIIIGLIIIEPLLNECMIVRFLILAFDGSSYGTSIIILPRLFGWLVG